MILLFDNSLQLINEVKKEVVEAQQTVELNGQTKAIVRMVYSAYDQSTSYFGYNYENNFYLYKITETKKDGPVIELQGIHIFFDELKGKVIRDVRPNNVTALQVTNDILNGLGWAVTSDAQGLNSSTFYHISVLEAFYHILETWGCEFELKLSFSGGKLQKAIHLSNRISKDYGKWYEYGDKLIEVVAEENHSEVYTAFIGRGKGEETDGGGYGRKIKFTEVLWSVARGNPVDKPVGQDYIEIKSATELYGYPDGTPRIGVVDFDNIEDVNKLIQATYNYALENARPKLHLKAQAYETNRIEIGEMATIIRPDINIRYKTRIFKCVTNLLTKQQTFEFGEPLSVSVGQRFKAQSKQIDKKVTELVESKMQTVINNINIDYYNEDGFNYELKANNEFDLPAGYYSFDKPIDENPTKVVYMGAGKVLIADELDPNGQWVWRTAITPEGLVGSEIIANSLIADQIESGTLSSKDGASWLNLDNGSFSFGNGAISFNQDEGFHMTLTDSIRQDIENAQKYTWIMYSDGNLEVEDMVSSMEMGYLDTNIGSQVVFTEEEISSRSFNMYGTEAVFYAEKKDYKDGEKYVVSFTTFGLNSGVDVFLDITIFGYITKILVDEVEQQIEQDTSVFEGIIIPPYEDVKVVIEFTSNGGEGFTMKFQPKEFSGDVSFEIGDFELKKLPTITKEFNNSAYWGYALNQDSPIPSEDPRDYTWQPIMDTNLISTIQQSVSKINYDLSAKISEIEKLNESIETRITSIEAEQGELIEANSTSLKQDDESFKATISSVKMIEDKLVEMQDYLTFENGAITLGSSVSPVQWVQTKDKVSFVSNGEELASWTTEEMKVKRLTVDDLFVALKIQIGNHIVEKYDGNTSAGKTTIVRRIN